jgi:hypothetical protein
MLIGLKELDPILKCVARSRLVKPVCQTLQKPKVSSDPAGILGQQITRASRVAKWWPAKHESVTCRQMLASKTREHHVWPNGGQQSTRASRVAKCLPAKHESAHGSPDTTPVQVSAIRNRQTLHLCKFQRSRVTRYYACASSSAHESPNITSVQVSAPRNRQTVHQSCETFHLEQYSSLFIPDLDLDISAPHLDTLSQGTR